MPAIAQVYWTVPAVLKSFFAKSTKVGFKSVTLTDAQAKEIGKQLGTGPVKKDWTVYVASSDGGAKRDGFALVDDEKGMHEPIDFAVQFGRDGCVERVEILVYREPYGDEVRQARYRDQFKGKCARDPITAGRDIDIVSGASISSKSVAFGVKRDTLVLQAAVGNGL